MNFSASSGRGGERRRLEKKWRAGWWAGLFALGGILAAAQAAPPKADALGRDYRPDNVFAYPAKLSLDLRRIAVLPLAAEASGNDLAEGCTALTPAVWEQLVKAKRFELVAVDNAGMRRATGKVGWTGAEMLPPDFLGFLRREYACDGVLFVELTSYRAYAPLAVGWRFKLVDARSGQIVWAADELFDAAIPAVSHAAQQFAEPRFFWPFGREENWLAVNSPRQFGRYAAAAVLDRLPER
jgi:hypothetical protein